MGFLAWVLKNGIGVALGILVIPLLARAVWHGLQALPWPPPFWWALLGGAGLASLVHLFRRPGYFYTLISTKMPMP